MARTLEIALPQQKADRLVQELDGMSGLIGVARHQGASLKPPGDVLTVHLTNEGLLAIQHILDRIDLGNNGSVVSSEPRSVVSLPDQEQIDRETHEGSLEEMASLLRRETNVGPNYLMAMAFSGAIAAVGLWTDTLHVVIAAMVIAPGFEPLMRMPFGLVVGDKDSVVHGLRSSAAGYLALTLGALLCLWLLRALGVGADTDLTTRSWVRYWSSVTPPGVILALAGGAAGMAIIAAQRSVLTAGVMIALALIPAMTIVGMGLAAGQFALVGKGLLRWMVDALGVMIAAGVVLFIKRRLTHRRRITG